MHPRLLLAREMWMSGSVPRTGRRGLKDCCPRMGREKADLFHVDGIASLDARATHAIVDLALWKGLLEASGFVGDGGIDLEETELGRGEERDQAIGSEMRSVEHRHLQRKSRTSARIVGSDSMGARLTITWASCERPPRCPESRSVNRSAREAKHLKVRQRGQMPEVVVAARKRVNLEHLQRLDLAEMREPGRH